MFKTKEGRREVKTFFDCIFIDNDKLSNGGIEYPVKLEYFKIITPEENVEAKYGIEIVKTEYKNGNVNVENKKVKNVTDNGEEANRILTILRDNEVTPIGMQDILEDMFADV